MIPLLVTVVVSLVVSIVVSRLTIKFSRTKGSLLSHHPYRRHCQDVDTVEECDGSYSKSKSKKGELKMKFIPYRSSPEDPATQSESSFSTKEELLKVDLMAAASHCPGFQRFMFDKTNDPDGKQWPYAYAIYAEMHVKEMWHWYIVGFVVGDDVDSIVGKWFDSIPKDRKYV